MPMCPNCGAQQPDDGVFCDECGASLLGHRGGPQEAGAVGQGQTVVASSARATVLCPICGAAASQGDPFCINCGAPLRASNEVAQSPPPHLNGRTVVASNGGAPMPSYRPVSDAMPSPDVLICRQCGASLEPGSAFCDICGTPVGVPAEPAASQETAVPGAATQEPLASAPTLVETVGMQKGAQGLLPSSPQPDPYASTHAQPQGALVLQGSGLTLTLSPGKLTWLIGREDPLSGIFPDIDLTEHGGAEGGVSRTHARIELHGQQFYIEDLDSTNHTILNRKKLVPQQLYPLQEGDRLRFGRLKVSFHIA